MNQQRAYRLIAIAATVIGGCLPNASNKGAPLPDDFDRDDASSSLEAGSVESGAPADTGAASDSSTSDASTDAPANLGAFAGAPPYQATNPAGNSNNIAHGANPNPAGRECLACHKPGGSAAGSVFGAAGTIYTSKEGVQAAGAQIEVRILGPNGAEVGKAYTDANGSFWFDGIAAGQTPTGSKVGIRKGGQIQLMSGDLSSGACLACHFAGSRIAL